MAEVVVNALKTKLLRVDRAFDEAFPGIVDELVQDDEENPQLKAAAILLRECLNYNTFDGKKARGKMVVQTLHFLSNGKASEEEVKKVIYLGWCVEILQALFLVADDIMDKSTLRRGKPCWYKKVGLISINETYLLEQCIFKLIDKHFSNERYLVDLYRAFHNTFYLTAMGQEIDMFYSDNPNRSENDSIRNFDMNRFKSIVKYKTAYYSFYLPVSLGMYIACIEDKQIYKQAEEVLLKLGEYFQIQDDYLDCFGDPAVTGKIGRDIEDKKCSWLVVRALEVGSEDDKLTLENNYGKEDTACVQVVKDLYEKLGIEQLFSLYEEESYRELCEVIENQNKSFPKDLFLFLVSKIYKRKK